MTGELSDDELAFLRGVLDLAREGETGELAAVIERGVPVNLTGGAGDSLLILAAYHDHPATVRMLLERGADPNRVNDRGQTALGAAVFRRSIESATALLDHGADPDAGSRPATEIAAFFELDEMAALLARRSRSQAERMIEANGVQLCTEAFGETGDPPILLVMGTGASMLWWEEGFCRMLADGGRFVIRYDHRDTGRSVTYEHGRPGYTGSDLVDDAAGVLDAYDIPAAHIVGVSAGGGLAQLLALDHQDRVSSLVLISTSRALPGGRDLPGPTEEFGRFVTTVRVDWSDSDSVIDYLVGYQRMLAGGRRPFDEAAARDLVRRDVERARDFAATQNHDAIPDDDRRREPLSSIRAPTLVIHGTADPMFPIEHGEALAEEIPGARLLPLDGAGHGIDRADWEPVVRAILEHTA